MKKKIGFTLSGTTHYLKPCGSKVFAFTMAEILVTMTVIATVVILTIFVFQNSIQQSQFDAGVKKFYSSYLSAQLLIDQNDGGLITPSGPPVGDYNLNLLAKYMSFQKLCYTFWGHNTYGFPGPQSRDGADLSARGCLYTVDQATPPCEIAGSCPSYSPTDTNWWMTYANGEGTAGGILTNGMIVILGGGSGDVLYVDVNGFAKPNAVGKDQWQFIWDTNKKMYVPYLYKQSVYFVQDSTLPLSR